MNQETGFGDTRFTGSEKKKERERKEESGNGLWGSQAEKYKAEERACWMDMNGEGEDPSCVWACPK